jgi:hypothetical protein
LRARRRADRSPVRAHEGTPGIDAHSTYTGVPTGVRL